MADDWLLTNKEMEAAHERAHNEYKGGVSGRHLDEAVAHDQARKMAWWCVNYIDKIATHFMAGESFTSGIELASEELSAQLEYWGIQPWPDVEEVIITQEYGYGEWVVCPKCRGGGCINGCQRHD